MASLAWPPRTELSTCVWMMLVSSAIDTSALLAKPDNLMGILTGEPF